MVVNLVLIVIALATCGGKLERVHGLVVKVQNTGILEIELIHLVDDDGHTWKFEGSGTYGEFTPAHLKQHMLVGEKIEVTFHRKDGRLLIDRLTDYP